MFSNNFFITKKLKAAQVKIVKLINSNIIMEEMIQQ